ncbi:hypothetical protein AYI69_g341 [Smittium culicis]|uniref:Uncharacterized protein n=1 Tax=Smittium culicis TaxID=133412 RepID=A0A1R1YTB7_9FUNG|nr:hypothetical protein AYI69_g341 [Smittium culicis]
MKGLLDIATRFYSASGATVSAASNAGLFLTDKCHELPASGDISVSVFMIIGTYLSYTPQIYKIYNLRSSEGISPYFILLGSLGAVSNIFNYLILHFWIIECCQKIVIRFTHPSILFPPHHYPFSPPYYKTLFLKLKSFFNLYLEPSILRNQTTWNDTSFRPVYPIPHSLESENSSPNNQPSSPSYLYTETYQETLKVAHSILLYITFLTLATFTFSSTVGISADVTKRFAQLLGIFSLMVTMTQFLPQIFKTFRMKRVGSFSIPMMLIQTPGGFLFSYILAKQPDSNWTSWISTLFAACFQGILLMLCLYFQYVAKTIISSPGSGSGSGSGSDSDSDSDTIAPTDPSIDTAPDSGLLPSSPSNYSSIDKKPTQLPSSDKFNSQTSTSSRLVESTSMKQPDGTDPSSDQLLPQLQNSSNATSKTSTKPSKTTLNISSDNAPGSDSNVPDETSRLLNK